MRAFITDIIKRIKTTLFVLLKRDLVKIVSTLVICLAAVSLPFLFSINNKSQIISYIDEDGALSLLGADKTDGEPGALKADGIGASSININELEELKLPVRFTLYTVVAGDMIGSLAKEHDLNTDSIISVNGIQNSRLLRIGQQLRIPNQDGILYTATATDTLLSIAEKNDVPLELFCAVNEVSPDTVISKGRKLFLPGLRLSRNTLQEINGDLFNWPVNGRLSSYYGYRRDPFTGVNQFHNGLDIAAPWGSALKAAMAGRVIGTGFDHVSGNYIIINHHSGYRSFYGHLSNIRVKTGDYVQLGQRIGDVGSTGYSTGSHVHFTVYKNGRTVNPLYLLR